MSTRHAHPKLEWLCKAVLLLLAVYHVATGVVAIFFPDFSFPFYDALYHADPLDTAQYRLILKPWGAYAIFTGAVLFAAWREPRRFRPVIVALVGLLAMRCSYRLAFAADAWVVFGIDAVRNWTNVLLMTSYVVVLAPWCLLSWLDERRAGVEASAGAQSPAAGRLVGAAPSACST
jgi:ABC-type Fe3+-siderophore transport system permease subunit